MIKRERRQPMMHTAALADAAAPHYDYPAGARVLTCDGYLGVVTAVTAGPYPGTEDYEVKLDGGLGGGTYASGQLRAAPAALTAGTASLDYPQLAQVLADHPDPARSITAAVHTAAAEMSLGETIVPQRTPGPGPTKPRSFADNPGSSGWACGPDPDNWSGQPLFPLDQRLGADQHIAVSEESLGYCTACGKEGHREKGCPAINGAAWMLRRTEHKAESNGHLMAPPTSHSDHNGSPWQMGLPFHHFRSYCYGCGADVKANSGGESASASPRIHQPCQHSPLEQLQARRLAAGDTGAEATLHEEPQPALPSTDGGMTVDDTDAEALTPQSFTAAYAAANASGCTECGGNLGSSAFPSCPACSSYTHHGNCCPRTESTPGMDDVVRNIDALHRGLQLRLPDDLHRFANDPEGDRNAQARSLVDHIARTGDEAHAHGLGLSWTDDHDFARDYAYGRPGTTSVILHARPPAPEHVENDRAALAGYPGSPARYQGKDWPEIPLKRDAPVQLTGLSWRTDGDGPRWRHHDFGDTGVPHHAAEAPASAELKTPSTPSAAQTLAEFQARAAHLDPRSSGGAVGDADIAAAAAAHLAGKTAMKAFSPAEQQALIDEGPSARAANAHRMDLTGTHYADLAQLLGGEHQEDDPTWLIAP